MKPRSFGEILDGAFTLYRRGFVAFAGVVLLTSVVPVATHLLLGSPMPGDPAFWAYRLVNVVMHAVAWIAITWHASRLYMGGPARLEDGLRALGAALLPLLGAWLIAFVLYGLPVVLGARLVFGMGARTIVTRLGPAGMVVDVIFLLGFAALVVVALAPALAVVPAVVLEGAGPGQAVSRSFRLASRAFLRVGALILVAAALALLVVAAPRALLGADSAALAPGSLTRGGVMMATRALLVPFLVVASVMMYYDLRVRTEGLDLQLAADEPGRKPGTVPLRAASAERPRA